MVELCLPASWKQAYIGDATSVAQMSEIKATDTIPTLAK
jgi:hypothetical protein